MPTYHPLYSTQQKIDEKQQFNECFFNFLKRYFDGPSNRLIIAGDLNIVEPSKKSTTPSGFEYWDHVYESILSMDIFDCFRKFEPSKRVDSWYSKTESARFDHIFCDLRMLHSVRNCYYDHNVVRNKLSDHSAMFLEVF